MSNGNVGTKACDDEGKARMEIVPCKDYILLPLWPVDPSFSQSSKSSSDAGFKPSGDDEEKKDVIDNNTNIVNTVTSTVSVASTNEDNVVGGKTSIDLLDDPYMLALEDDSIFGYNNLIFDYLNDDEDVGVEADMNNLDTFMHLSPIPTTRVHKDHSVKQIIGDLNSLP
ncbi:hypothetical protein Tco_1574264 [Tanacetum coccineum]